MFEWISLFRLYSIWFSTLFAWNFSVENRFELCSLSAATNWRFTTFALHIRHVAPPSCQIVYVASDLHTLTLIKHVKHSHSHPSEISKKRNRIWLEALHQLDNFFSLLASDSSKTSIPLLTSFKQMQTIAMGLPFWWYFKHGICYVWLAPNVIHVCVCVYNINICSMPYVVFVKKPMFNHCVCVPCIKPFFTFNSYLLILWYIFFLLWWMLSLFVMWYVFGYPVIWIAFSRQKLFSSALLLLLL